MKKTNTLLLLKKKYSTFFYSFGLLKVNVVIILINQALNPL